MLFRIGGLEGLDARQERGDRFGDVVLRGLGEVLRECIHDLMLHDGEPPIGNSRNATASPASFSQWIARMRRTSRVFVWKALTMFVAPGVGVSTICTTDSRLRSISKPTSVTAKRPASIKTTL